MRLYIVQHADSVPKHHRLKIAHQRAMLSKLNNDADT